jgi:phage-related protein
VQAQIERLILNIEYEIEYVEIKNNDKPFEEFVLSLNTKDRAKIFETINYFLELKNNNLPIKEKLSKHVEDGIFELRTHLSDRIARAFYFYIKGAKIIITHGFIKKSQKTPTKEIERAKVLRKIYNDRRGL